MDDITKAELLALISGGKDCNQLEKYKMYYKLITGKTHGGGCGSCACKWLFTWLTAYIKNS